MNVTIIFRKLLIILCYSYTRIHREDDTGEHKLELGYVQIKAPQPDAVYQDVLKATRQRENQREPLLRIFCQYQGAVGGIPVKEHFEVNIVPLTISISNKFATKVQQYFFPKRKRTTMPSDLVLFGKCLN